MEGEIFFQGKYVPAGEAKVGIMTHALHYGTGVFEGIRGYWNADHQQMYLFRVEEHFERMHKSCKIMRIRLPHSAKEMTEIATELVRRNDYRTDVYIRPLAYKSSEVIGVRLHDLEDGFAMLAVPFGNYIDVDNGIRVMVSGWRRVDDNMIPPRAKVTGAYANSALAKSEAIENGYDEAVMLTHEGFISEGSGENIFLVSKGHLITPPVTDNILSGITRNTIMHIAQEELGLRTHERSIARSELYTADEAFFTGTGAQLSPIVEADHRSIGTGEIGEISAQLQRLYFDIVRGDNPKYLDWCLPVYPSEKIWQAAVSDLAATQN